MVAALTWLAFNKPPLQDGVPLSQAVYDRDGHLLRLALASDEKYRLWLPLADMSPALIEATLLHEDRYFYRHPGINPLALLRAAGATYLGSARIGGSTITMQVARLRYRLYTRSLLGKFGQMLRALQLEWHYSKDEILAAYLNLAPYGGNIEGVGAASRIYFGKDALKLTTTEALTLSVIPQSPTRRALGAGERRGDRVAHDATADTASLAQARIRLYDHWLQVHPQDRDLAGELALPLSIRGVRALPFAAPHFTDEMLHANPQRSRISTTLDLPLQRLLDRQIRRYIERKKSIGINNAAALLIDYRDMGVRAAVGSADFFAVDIQGQVNGTLAKRSPGSTLKPFIYALGMDQGLIHPLTMLKDAPTSFGAYNPENFDGEFSGPVHAYRALVRSRNVPAVQVAAQLKAPTLYEFLRRANVSRLRSESHYGLALVLGGGEVTMHELVQLYAMLANGGRWQPLRTLLDAPPHSAALAPTQRDAGTQLLSAEASFLTLDMLRKTPPPAQAFRSDWTRDNLPIYWKTGTSFGFRDAWAVGIFGPYVLAVWSGNFDGHGNPAFTGIDAAAPLFFNIVGAIKSHRRDLPAPVFHTEQLNLARVEVCALSGQIPHRYCPHRRETWFIPGTSPIALCDVHREVFIDKNSGARMCSASKHTRAAVFEYWPSDLLKIFRQAGIPRRLPPPAPAVCAAQAVATGLAPQITSPQTGLIYSVRARETVRSTVSLSAVSDADARMLYWFIDEKFIVRTVPGQAYEWPAKAGRFTVRVVDDHGRADVREMQVEVVQ